MADTEVIRTPDQRLRVFVSSTLRELAPERQAVRDAVTRLRLIPVLFELGARPHPPRQVYRSYLAQSQVFVGVYWQSYGWVAPGEQLSGLEYEYLMAVGLPGCSTGSAGPNASRSWRRCSTGSGKPPTFPISTSPPPQI